MTDLARLQTALVNADAAGDIAAATAIAQEIRRLQAQPAAQSPGILSEIGQATGKTARAAMEGVGGLIGLFTDPLDAGVSALAGRKDPTLSGLITGEAGQQRMQHYPMAQAASDFADWIGLPKPESAGERVASSIISAGSGAGGTIGTGRALAGLAQRGGSELMERAGRFFAADPGLQLASTTAAGGSAQGAAESGASPEAQALFGVAAGTVPGSAATLGSASMRAIRGGEAGRQAMQQRVGDFEAAGTSPTLGQATDNRFHRASESLLARVPGSAGRMVKAAESQADDVARRVQGVSENLSPRATAETAGRRIEEGVRGPGGFVSRFKQKAGELYAKVDEAMPGETPVSMKATQAFLDKHAKPIAGAEATSELLAGQQPLIQQVRNALGKDAQGGAMPYEAVKALRTKVGEMIADAGPLSNQPVAQLKQLYGALSQDVRSSAATNPKARQALDRAESFYKAGTQRVEAVDRIVSRAGGPEAVFNAAVSGTKDGATKLRSVMQSLRPEERKALTATVVQRLGRATPGRQTAEGDAFSMETFLTNWNKLAPEAKRALFDRERGLSDAMNRIARAAESVRQGNQTVQNASGTAAAALQASAATTFLMSLLSGNAGPAAGLAATAGGSNLIARLMTNGNFVRWMARQTQMPKGAVAAQVAVLGDMARHYKDDDLRAAAELFQSSATSQ